MQRANEILPALTDHCFFVCAADETLVRMHQWHKLFRNACIFFAFVLVLTLTTSTSALLYQVQGATPAAWTAAGSSAG